MLCTRRCIINVGRKGESYDNKRYRIRSGQCSVDCCQRNRDCFLHSDVHCLVNSHLSPSEMRAHPDVLLVRWHVYATAKKWEMAVEVARAITKLLPENSFGWVHWAFSLHELKRTKEAWGVLVPVVDKFPDEYIIRYNLACYACQLGNLKEAWQWLEKAFDFGDSKNLKLMALDDHDLEPLWTDISEI